VSFAETPSPCIARDAHCKTERQEKDALQDIALRQCDAHCKTQRLCDAKEKVSLRKTRCKEGGVLANDTYSKTATPCARSQRRRDTDAMSWEAHRKHVAKTPASCAQEGVAGVAIGIAKMPKLIMRFLANRKTPKPARFGQFSD